MSWATARLAAMFSIIVAGTFYCGAGAVAIDLRVPRTALLGDDVPLRLSFTNTGDEPIYVQFSGRDYGADSLVICARKGDVFFRVGQIHLDADIALRRFDFVPLRSEQRFETPILGINDPTAASLPILRLPEAGTYEVFAKYESTGSTEAGVLWPIWRGVAWSSRETLILADPPASVLSERRQALQSCAASPDDCATAVIGYFQVVRDSGAANVLAGMLDLTTVPDPLLAAAVANQRGAESRLALARFARRYPSYAKLVEDLIGGSPASPCDGHR